MGIRVLIVDDSIFFQNLLCHELIKYLPQGSVLECAGNPFEARDKILSFEPDVMVLDVEMPRMDGVEFLRRLLSQYSLPTIMLSSSEYYKEKSLAAGAVDFIVKPLDDIIRCGKVFFPKLAKMVMKAADSTVVIKKYSPNSQPAARSEAGIQSTGHVIAIGSSTGGTEAVSQLLMQLAPPLPGIVIVQHIPPMFSRMFAERLDHCTQFHVKEAQTGDVVRPNSVLIAPGDKHLRIKPANGGYVAECAEGERVSGHCPSVDVLFSSVAKACASQAVGIILTGMGRDGAKGLLEMRQSGARTIGQDEASSVVYGMPRVAWEIGAVERQLPLDAIPGALISLVR